MMSIRMIGGVELRRFYSHEMRMGLQSIQIGWDFRNYGTDSAAELYLQNNAETQGYDELQNQTDVEVFRVFARDQILRDRAGGIPRTFKQFKRKISGRRKSRDCFKKTKGNIEQKGERRQSFEEKQSRLAKVERINLIGDFEQRRSGWSSPGNKAACFECGNTDRFKAQFPIWIKKKEKWAAEWVINKRKGGGTKGKGEGGTDLFACLEGEEVGP